MNGSGPPPGSRTGDRRHEGRLLLAVILILSLGARVCLALQGGQYFFGDEGRHQRGVDLWLTLEQGQWSDARVLLAMPEHAGFVWLTALLTPLQHALARFTVHGNWSEPGNIFASSGIAAALLGVFSVLNIWLVGRLARSAGAEEDEVRWAVLLAAASNTLFYYSRHLLPYDAALSAWLASLLLTGSSRSRVRIAGGTLAGLTYHFYNGYWFLLPLAFAWSLRRPVGETARRRIDPWWLLGGAAGLGLPLLVGTICGGRHYWMVLLEFSGTVKQGLFAEGWSLPWEFLGHSEGWLGLAVAVAIVAALLRFRHELPARVSAWLFLLAGAYGLMVLMSTVLQHFVIYARTARPLVPLLCLLGGWAAHALTATRPRGRPAAMAAVALAALLQIAPHFPRVFPREVEARVLTELGNPKHTLSVTGSIYRPPLLPVTRPDYVLVNAQLLFPVRDYAGYPRGDVVLSWPNPLDYPPYQYEGHTPRERRLLRENDIAVKLIRLADPRSLPDHPPAAFIFTAADRPDGRDHGRP